MARRHLPGPSGIFVGLCGTRGIVASTNDRNKVTCRRCLAALMKPKMKSNSPHSACNGSSDA